MLDKLDTAKLQVLGILAEAVAAGATVVVVVGAVVVLDEAGAVVVGLVDGEDVTTSSGVMPVAQDAPLSVEYSKRITGAPLVLPKAPAKAIAPLLLVADSSTGGAEALPTDTSYTPDCAPAPTDVITRTRTL